MLLFAVSAFLWVLALLVSFACVLNRYFDDMLMVEIGIDSVAFTQHQFVREKKREEYRGTLFLIYTAIHL